MPEATKYIDINISHRYSARPAYYAQCAFVKALILTAQDQYDEAWHLVDSVIAFANETHNAYIAEIARSFKVELAVRQNRVAEAERLRQDVHFEHLPPLWLFYYSQLTPTKLQLAMGGPDNYQAAAEQLAQYDKYGKETHNTTFRIQVLALKALLKNARGEENGARTKLSESLALAEPGGFIRTYVDLGSDMQHLLTQMRSHTSVGKAAAYIDRVLSAFPSQEPQATTRPPAGMVEELTGRELQTLRLLATELTTEEIADNMVVTVATVRTHTKHLYDKLGAHSRFEAVQRGKQLGMIQA